MADATKIIEMKQERATLVTSIRALINEFEGKEMVQDKKDELGKMEGRFDALNASITSEERQLERERIIGEQQNQQRDNEPDKDKELRAAFLRHMQYGSSQTLSEYRALAQDNPTQAGYLVAPEKFVSEVIKELNNVLFFRQIAKVLPPLQGAQSLGYPKRTARMGSASWGTEIAAPTTDSTLAFGKRQFKPQPSSAEILVSKTLIRNAPNTEGIVRDEFTFMFGALQETAYMTGTGANQPLGVFTASADGISTSRDVSTGNTDTEIKFDGLFEAKYAIKEQYQPRLEWIFHRDGVKKIAKLKDSNGQYIWQPSVVADQPDRLLARPVRMSEYAPSTFTTGQYVGIIGDFNNYWICDSLAMEIQVLMELYARTNQIDYMARIETDGMPVLEECFARVKLA